MSAISALREVPCRGCNRVSRKWPSGVRRLSSYDDTSRTYVCVRCYDRLRATLWRSSVVCRGCGRGVERPPSKRRALKSAEQGGEGATYLCPPCGARRRRAAVEVVCRRCGRVIEYAPGSIGRLKTLEQRGGILTHLCKSCSGRVNMHKAQARALAEYDVTPAAAPAHRLQALQEHRAAMVKKAGGQTKLVQLSRASTMSKRGRRRQALGKFIRRNRDGELRLCPLCRKLIYLGPARVRLRAPGFHGACWAKWQAGAEYKQWRRDVGNTADPMVRFRLRQFPLRLPARPRGKPAGPEQLDRHFRWLLRYFGLGHSWRQIAEQDHYSHGAVRKGVHALIALLPESWIEVFPSSKRGHQLEQLLPAKQLRRAAAVSVSPGN